MCAFDQKFILNSKNYRVDKNGGTKIFIQECV